MASAENDQPEPADPALDLARELTGVLADLTKRLESPTADEILKEDARHAIRRMYDAWSCLGSDNVLKRDGARRELLFSLCEKAADQVLGWGETPGNAEEHAIQLILKTYGDLVEEHRAKLAANDALVLALVRAHMRAEAVLDVKVSLARVMGFGAEHESLQRAERRARAKQRGA